MAILKHAQTGRELALPHRTLIGRGSEVDARIDDKRVSTEHATVTWSGDMWTLKDLASRNGTVVDNQRLKPGVRVALTRGMKVHFGSPEQTWILTDASPPDIVAIDLDSGQMLEGEHGHLQLTEGSTLSTEDGTLYVWAEAGVRSPVADREVIESAGRKWRICLPPEPTIDVRTITAEGVIFREQLQIHIHVSPDEEHVQVTLLAPNVKRALRPRSFDYMLLALARARLAESQDPAVPPSEQGWVFSDELAVALNTDVNHINVDIYRARRRFADAGVEGADELIERRASTRAVRLSTSNIVID